jgi:hypothetical protein
MPRGAIRRRCSGATAALPGRLRKAQETAPGDRRGAAVQAPSFPSRSRMRTSHGDAMAVNSKRRRRVTPSFSASTRSALDWANSSARFRARFSKLRTYSRPASLRLKPGSSILSIYTLIMTLPKWQPDLRYSSARAMSCISNVSSITGLIPRCSIIPIMRSNISTDPTTTP